VIESLYRKVNGSLEGLNKRLGITTPDDSTGAQVNSIAAKTSANSKSRSSNFETSPKLSSPTERKSANRPDPPATRPRAKPVELPSAKEPLFPLASSTALNAINSTEKNVPSQLALNDGPAPPLKLIELPTISGAESAIPLASSVDFNGIISTFDNTPAKIALDEAPPAPKPIELPTINGAGTIIPLPALIDSEAIISTFQNTPSLVAINDDPPPPPPGPKVHTRKRRVTAPDDQQRDQ
jgi:hypothetical protein